jgi:SAM-dependent methyltransferase/GNAT superfamily N-acetyltransferase
VWPTNRPGSGDRPAVDANRRKLPLVGTPERECEGRCRRRGWGLVIEVLDLSDSATAAEVLAVQHAAYRAEAELIGDDRIPPLHESLEELTACTNLQWRGIRSEGRLVAAMAVTGVGRQCDIDRLIVHPDHARRGHGRNLVGAILHHSVVTVSTASRNAPARALYESLGFHVGLEREVTPGLMITDFERTNAHLRTSFDSDVANYEAARPPYPVEVFDVLTERCGLGPWTRVMEIGPGTGQATIPLLDRGARIVAFELGAAMAAGLRARTAGREVVVHNEDFDRTTKLGRYSPFDMCVSATAFHWVTVATAIPKIADHLVSGGWLALWWNVYRDLGLGDGEDPFGDAVGRIAARFQTKGRQTSVTHANDISIRKAEITAGNRFEFVDHIVWRWDVIYTPDEARALFASFSDWNALPEPLRSQCLDDVAEIVRTQFHGSVTRTFSTAMYLARRT